MGLGPALGSIAKGKASCEQPSSFPLCIEGFDPDILSLMSQRVCVLLAAVISLASGLLAQNGTGRITGIVTDPSGAVVQSAKVTVRETGSGLTKGTATDQTGAWAVPALPAGRYVVLASAPGFANAKRDGVFLSAGAEVTADLNLLPAAQTNSVTVSGLTGPDRDTVAPELIKTNDTAGLVRDFSGVDLFNDGGLSGIPAIHGLADERVAVRVDGMEIGSACDAHESSVVILRSVAGG